MTIQSQPTTGPRDDLVAAITTGTQNTHLALAWMQSWAGFRVQRADISSDVSAIFLEQARAAAGSLAERTAVSYDPEWPLRNHEYFELAGPEVPASGLFASLQDFYNLKRLTRKHLTKPRLYVLCVQTAHGIALFGRKMAELKVLKQRTNSVFAAVWDGDSFNALEHSVATFATTFDWIYWNDAIYVLDSAGFHRVFRDGKALTDAVSKHVDDIASRVNVRNADLFKKRCSRNVAMASKLKRISEHGLHLTHTVEELRSYAAQYDIHVQWDDDGLVFEDTLSGQWEILKLLDEDRTEGPVSHRRYESAAKRVI